MNRKYIFSLFMALGCCFFATISVQAQDDKDKEKLERYNAYTPISWFYNEYWAKPLANASIQNLNKVLFPRVKADAKILDLMCGTGHITQALKKRGYKMTGLDGSDGMLNFARINAPGIPFMLDDARTFDMSNEFDAVICMNNGLNHILKWEELVVTSRKVYTSLKKGGYFIFDINLEDRYKRMFRGSNGVQRKDFACLYAFNYDAEKRKAAINFTMFLAADEAQSVWKRVTWQIAQHCYSHLQIISALEKAGLTVVKLYDGYEDLKSGRHNKGRRFYVCQKK